MKSPDTDHLMSRREVEQRYGIPRRFLELAVSRGGGPRLVRIGRLVRYRAKDIEAWIELNTSEELS